MDKILAAFGIPYKLGSDNGPPFNSQQFATFAKQKGFKHIHVTPYAPWANGTVEHFMRNLGKVMKTSTVTGGSWRTELTKFLQAYRATPHTMTGFSPAHLLFNGRPYKTRLPTAIQPTEYVNSKEVQENDRNRKAKAKAASDSKRYVKPLNIQPGDIVLCRQKQKNKASTPYNATPYQVVSVKGSQVVATNHKHTITRHITFFKKVPKTMKEQHNQVKRRKSMDIESSTDSATEEENDDHESDSDETIPYAESSDDSLSDSEEGEERPTRPVRTRRLPVRYRE